MPKKSLEHFDLDAFSARLGSESDRACAVLGAALLDAKLEDLFRERFLAYQDELLGNSGPLGSFSSRIRLACALAWISEDARHDLDVIRDIRNTFAHSFDHELSFIDQSVAARCSNLRSLKELFRGTDYAATQATNVSPAVIHAMGDALKPPRMRFQVAVEFLSQYLDQLARDAQSYVGPDLLEDCYALGARTRVSIQATATVGPPVSGTEG